MIAKEHIPALRALQRGMQEKFRNVPAEGKSIKYLGKEFIVYPSVFWPHEDSKVLIKGCKINDGETVLDLCTGSGVIAIFSALKGAKKVVALDINPAAIKAAKKNSEINGVARKVDARVSDMFVALKPGEKFDVITINPPFTDLAAKDLSEKNIWDQDFHVHTELFKHAKAHLKRGGRIYLCQASFGNVERMLQMARDNGYYVRKIGQNKFDMLRTFYAFELTLSQP